MPESTLTDFEFKFIGTPSRTFAAAVPVTPAGFNKRTAEQQAEDEVPENARQVMAQLRQSPFHLIQHTRPGAQGLTSISLGCLRTQNTETADFWLVADDGTEWEHYGVLYSDIRALMPIPLRELLAVMPKAKKPKLLEGQSYMAEETNLEYFHASVKPWLLAQGFTALWKANHPEAGGGRR